MEEPAAVASAEAQENVALQIAEQMSDFLLTGAVANAINMPSVSAEDAPRLKPYMELCRLLGGFAIIHARTSYTRPDGSEGAGWYTDDWQLRPEGWRCVSAHVSRS